MAESSIHSQWSNYITTNKPLMKERDAIVFKHLKKTEPNIKKVDVTKLLAGKDLSKAKDTQDIDVKILQPLINVALHNIGVAFVAYRQKPPFGPELHLCNLNQWGPAKLTRSDTISPTYSNLKQLLQDLGNANSSDAKKYFHPVNANWYNKLDSGYAIPELSKHNIDVGFVAVVEMQSFQEQTGAKLLGMEKEIKFRFSTSPEQRKVDLRNAVADVQLKNFFLTKHFGQVSSIHQ